MAIPPQVDDPQGWGFQLTEGQFALMNAMQQITGSKIGYAMLGGLRANTNEEAYSQTHQEELLSWSGGRVPDDAAVDVPTPQYTGSLGGNNGIGLGFSDSNSPYGYSGGVGNAPTGQAPTFGGGHNPFGIDSMTGKPRVGQPDPTPQAPPPDEDDPTAANAPGPGPVGEGEI